MNNFYIIVVLFIVLSLTSCEKIEKKIVDSNIGENRLTILKFDDGKYIVNGEYNSDVKPTSDFIKADLILEYHIGLAKWNENRIEIYSQYGTFDTIAANGKLKLIKISTKEFEELKKDKTQYTHFYY